MRRIKGKGWVGLVFTIFIMIALVTNNIGCAPDGTNGDNAALSQAVVPNDTDTTNSTDGVDQTPGTTVNPLPSRGTTDTGTPTTKTGRSAAFMAMLDNPGITPDETDPVTTDWDWWNVPPIFKTPGLWTAGLQLAKEFKERNVTAVDQNNGIKRCECPKPALEYCSSDDEIFAFATIDPSDTPYLPQKTNWFSWKEPGKEIQNTIVTLKDNVVTPIYEIDKKTPSWPFKIHRTRDNFWVLTYKDKEYENPSDHCSVGRLLDRGSRFDGHAYRLRPVIKNSWPLFLAMKRYFKEVPTYPAYNSEWDTVSPPECTTDYMVDSVLKAITIKAKMAKMALKKPLSTKDITGTYEFTIEKGKPPVTYHGIRWIKKLCLLPGVFIEKTSAQDEALPPGFSVVTQDGKNQSLMSYLDKDGGVEENWNLGTKVDTSVPDEVFASMSPRLFHAALSNL